MTNGKSTKKALLSSVVALLLCFAMLLGTTFAWFTDSASSAVNRIYAGVLDVEVYRGLTINADKIESTTKLFDGVSKWEPGKFTYENLTIANVGDLAFNYQLAVNFMNATTNATGGTLADVLKVRVVEGGVTNPDALLNDVGNWEPMKSFILSSKLVPANDVSTTSLTLDSATKTYGIVIYWQPGANDNNYNMANSGNRLSIDLGINLVATQVVEGARFPETHMATGAELTSAIASANPGDTIKLTEDVNYGTNQLVIDKAITLDLNGKTLKTENNWGGLSITNGASIKNGTINHPGNTCAIKVTGAINTIENVNIIITPTEGKTKTGIQLYNGKSANAIKNVTITGATQGIEVAKGSYVGLIENATVNAVADGTTPGVALLVNAGSVGRAVNCSFTGDYGVHMMLNGEFHVALALENCTVASLYAHDEIGISNTTNCSLTLTYDAATVFTHSPTLVFEEECKSVVTINAPAN